MNQEIQEQRAMAVDTMRAHAYIRRNWSYGSRLLCYDDSLKNYLSAKVIGVMEDTDSIRIETEIRGRRFYREVRRSDYFVIPRPADVDTVLSREWFRDL